ncbi:ribonuclease H-like protein, partial [Calocera cornea HHB12733]
MLTFVRRYVSGCDTCQRTKAPRHKPYGLLQPLDVPTRPWHSISMDFIVKLPLSSGYDSIWVVVDRFTKMSHFVPCNETVTASGLASLFLQHIFRLHGFPQSIVSDRGSLFVSQFWQRFLELANVESNPSTAYHPQTNGQTERVNQELEQYLRAYCSYQQDDWSDLLPLAEFAYNNRTSASSQTSPFFANYGYHPAYSPRLADTAIVPAPELLTENLRHIHEELQAELQHAQDAYARHYNARHRSAPKFQPGDLVWLLRRNIRTTRPSDKLDFRRLGPFKILQRIGNLAYHLELPTHMKRLHPVFNVNLLEPYISPSNIDAILDVRKRGQRFEYFVNFKDCPVDERSWVPLSDLTTAVDELIERFHRRHPRKPRPAQSLFNPPERPAIP